MTENKCENKECQYYKERVKQMEYAQQSLHYAMQEMLAERDKYIAELLDKINNI